MKRPKVMEMRGEAPTLLPGRSEESWRGIQLGLGAAPLPTTFDLEPSEDYPPRPFAKFAKTSLRIVFWFIGLLYVAILALEMVNAFGSH